MKYFRNILWIILGGGLISLLWIIMGLIWCFTVIGIPVGVKCFEMALVQINPFDKQIIIDNSNKERVINFLWYILGGVELLIINGICSIILLLTVVGIDFGIEYLKMSKISIMPLNKKIIKKK